MLIPSDSSSTSSNSSNLNESTIFHEKNCITILTHSTTKNRCKLEFEMQVKADNTKTKSVLSGDRLQSESDDDNETHQQNNNDNNSKEKSPSSKRKYKCKIIINGVRVAANHAKTRVEAKRRASLKACKYLAKLYPLIRETSHTYSTSSSSSATNIVMQNNENNRPQQQQDNKPLTQQQQQQPSESYRYHKISKEALFSATTTLLPPTSFESTSSSSSFPLNVLNNNIMTSLFGANLHQHQQPLQFGSN